MRNDGKKILTAFNHALDEFNNEFEFVCLTEVKLMMVEGYFGIMIKFNKKKKTCRQNGM